ncbi:MAG TPA: class I SAM-dependent methyltransferase [Bryobacteraceae bacterium]|nr:class I SAM-dependent methyltransferase [Bryobacteraceae bacterium]HXJ37634.1 class I SAM-dependent methyltransferase [Bryobacteraceae bacterium]
MPAEFDKYAASYQELLDDPIRNRFAPGSAFFFERKWILIAEYFSRISLETSNADWLDVGCGRGELLRLGKPHFRAVAGCDVSAEMMAACNDLVVKRQEHLESLPFEDASFDFITAVCVFHHVLPEQRPLLLRDMIRVMRPGGVCCIIEHNPLNPVTQLIVHRTPVDADARLLSSGMTGRLMRSAGLSQCNVVHFLYFPAKLYARLRSVEALLARVPLGGQYAVMARKPQNGRAII